MLFVYLNVVFEGLYNSMNFFIYGRYVTFCNLRFFSGESPANELFPSTSYAIVHFNLNILHRNCPSFFSVFDFVGSL